MKIVMAVATYIFCSHAAFAVSQLEIDDQLVTDAMFSPQTHRVVQVLTLGEPLPADDQAILNDDFENDDVSWPQHGLLVTERNFDLAIAGQGFFWLIDGTTGTNRVTRDGRFKIDLNGNLVHWEHGEQVMKKTETGISNIRITDAARIVDITTGEEATIVSIWANENGSIHARYSNGELREICQLAIMEFDRPRDLTRIGRHLFEYDHSNLPRDSECSRVYGNSSEVLDEGAYMNMGFPRWKSDSTFD
jgi:hypothetical protein